MKIVIDSNILFAALIKESTTRWIILFLEADFYFPEPLFEEVKKYKKLIEEKSGLNEAEFSQNLKKILEYVSIIPTEDLQKYLEEATKIMEKIDPKDSVVLAAALSVKDCIIWSSDKDLTGQVKAKTVSTKELFIEYKKQISLLDWKN